VAVTAGQAARAGLAFATPGDWFPIRVPRERADVGRLADEAVAARSELARHWDALRDMLRSLIEACESLDVAAAYATVLDVLGGPLPATVVVAVRPMGGYSLDAIAEEMAAQQSEGLPPPVVGTFDLPAGRTVRIERMVESPGAADGRCLVSFTAQYVTEAPGGQAVILTFSTPAVALADRLRPLFHQMACTLRFEPLEPPR
jgi:hypothetical protein